MSRRRFSIVRIFRVRESGNTEFWIANFVVMASTIIGVYLAAQAGFKTALQFEVARSERDGFYMRRALLDEVKDNLSSVDDWSQTFEKALRNRISDCIFCRRTPGPCIGRTRMAGPMPAFIQTI